MSLTWKSIFLPSNEFNSFDALLFRPFVLGFDIKFRLSVLGTCETLRFMADRELLLLLLLLFMFVLNADDGFELVVVVVFVVVGLLLARLFKFEYELFAPVTLFSPWPNLYMGLDWDWAWLDVFDCETSIVNPWLLLFVVLFIFKKF